MKKLVLLLACLLMPFAAQAQGVVASADPRATEAGREMLRQGGSAADAAMAMMLALTVVEPQSSGIGGGGLLVHHDGQRGLIETVDGRETAPASATPGRFLDADGRPMPFRMAVPGGRSVGVPGNIRLMAMTHARWGKLPWAALFAPAIRLAEQGFAATRTLAGASAGMAGTWRDFPEIAALYAPGGVPVAVGQTVRNPALGRLLRAVAEQGPDAFYTGPIAQRIAAATTGYTVNPGDVSPADLAAYRAKDRPAVCGGYRGYTVCGMGPPSSGAITILQMLGMLERFDMARLGKGSPVAWHLLGEAMRLAYADRDTYLGDRDFVAVPVAGLIDPRYLGARSRLLSTTATLGRYTPGTPPGATARTTAPAAEVPSTTHFVAVDKDGDVASMTSTVEGPFGSQLVTDGMVLNNELTDFSFAPEKDGAPVANRVEPGKRPLSSMSPTIVYDRTGRPVLALGSAGGRRIIMHVMKTLVGVLDFGLPVADAVALPNLYFDQQGLMIEDNDAGRALAPAISALGDAARIADVPSKVTALQWTSAGWTGVADPRSVGTAANQ